MEEFNELFVSYQYFWSGLNNEIQDLKLLIDGWKNEEFINKGRPLIFSYWFNGFKKGGTNTFGVGFQLNFKREQYWYGFDLSNNNEQPFFKKLYHEQLTSAEIDYIVDTVYSFVLDNIEQGIERFNLEKK